MKVNPGTSRVYCVGATSLIVLELNPVALCGERGDDEFGVGWRWTGSFVREFRRVGEENRGGCEFGGMSAMWEGFSVAVYPSLLSAYPGKGRPLNVVRVFQSHTGPFPHFLQLRTILVPTSLYFVKLYCKTTDESDGAQENPDCSD
ncbi:hypothetical protein Bbelb_437140 [Branchiostoma belcheri]|nr:hypothetical protein Bbelb_437140 [Branchiostoma belcheri]